MKFYLSIASLFLMLQGTSYAESPDFVPLTENPTFKSPNFSFATGELNIPTVIVDGNQLYDVKMQLMNTENGMLFSLVNAVEQPVFEEIFETITNNMSKKEVINRLGMPQEMHFDLEIKLPYCDAPQLELGAIYDQWTYFNDSSKMGPSGFAVWFAKVEGVSDKELVVGKVNGYGCI
ncbi:hypothetical protein MNBD_GAMMA04-659 [hydrothermal vent metagenome]|uniref:Uncharacterized protein n=1 Tax=hydrothermal vent metagenome TaxID=652676 RepID=A0A3B0VN27_9ZZZZ